MFAAAVGHVVFQSPASAPSVWNVIDTSRSTISGAYLTGQIIGRDLVIVPSVRDAGVLIAVV